MEQTSGKDLKQFFKQWLYQSGYPKLQGTWTYDAANKEVVVQLEQTNQSCLNFLGTRLAANRWKVCDSKCEG